MIHSGPSCFDFFGRLVWLDGRPLLDTIEPYRVRLFDGALNTFHDDGRPQYSMVLSGRAKKNFKTTDLVLAGLYKFLVPESVQGNDAFILANDEEQAGDDLALAKKLIEVNDELASEVRILDKEIRRNDGRGTLKILPARDAIGAHGKGYIFLGLDEIHGYRNYDILEALAPDPTRQEVLQWITSYDTIYATPGVPLHDLKLLGKSGGDSRLLFSWYSGDDCTDPEFADLPPEERANPSIGQMVDGQAYLEQQRRRLPTHKFRRLHLNLPGAPNGAFLDQGAVYGAIVSGRRSVPYAPGLRYQAGVDMSGGSSDDACLAVAHREDDRIILDHLDKQAGHAPFNPRHAIERFAATIKAYGLSRVTGDNYAGETFKRDFEGFGIAYVPCKRSKSDIYEDFEPLLNAGEVELLDHPKLQEQLLTLVMRGSKVDHEPGGHDDHANAACLAIVEAGVKRRTIVISDELLRRSRLPTPYSLRRGSGGTY